MGYEQQRFRVEDGKIIYISEDTFRKRRNEDAEGVRVTPDKRRFLEIFPVRERIKQCEKHDIPSQDSQSANDEVIDISSDEDYGEQESVNIKNEVNETDDEWHASSCPEKSDNEDEDYENATLSCEASSEHERLSMTNECEDKLYSGSATCPSDKSDNQGTEDVTEDIFRETAVKREDIDDPIQFEEHPKSLDKSMSPDSGVDVSTAAYDFSPIQNTLYSFNRLRLQSESDFKPLSPPPPVLTLGNESQNSVVEIFDEDGEEYLMPKLSPQIVLPKIDDGGLDEYRRNDEEMEEDEDNGGALEECGSNYSTTDEENTCLDASLGEESDEEVLHSAHVNVQIISVVKTRKLIWCKICDTYWENAPALRNHITIIHQLDASGVNSKNYATWDLEIARSLDPPNEDEFSDNDD